MTPQTYLVVEELALPATKETPSDSPTNEVGHYPHPSLVPSMERKNEDPTFLTVGPPPGPTTRHPDHSSSTIDDLHTGNTQDQTTNWGTHTQTLLTLELWESINSPELPNPRYLPRVCSLCNTPMASLQLDNVITCHACRKKEEAQINTIAPETREGGKDDEQEYQFLGIPIAGENKGDSEEDWYHQNMVRIVEKDDEQDTDVEEEEDEQIPLARIDHTMDEEASDDIAFRIGPTKDGIMRMKKGKPITLNPNPFQPLEEDEGLNVNDTQTTQTWWATRRSEFQRLILHRAFDVVTNAQRVSNPFKIARKEHKRKDKERFDQMINVQLQYINNPQQKTPPQLDPHISPWWTNPGLNRKSQKKITRQENQTLYQNMVIIKEFTTRTTNQTKTTNPTKST
jgi:hypothetical protein